MLIVRPALRARSTSASMPGHIRSLTTTVLYIQGGLTDISHHHQGPTVWNWLVYFAYATVMMLALGLDVFVARPAVTCIVLVGVPAIFFSMRILAQLRAWGVVILVVASGMSLFLLLLALK